MDMAAIGLACSQAGLGCLTRAPELLSGGYSNLNYKISVGRDRYVLRFYRHPMLAVTEPKLLQLVHSRVPTPRVAFVQTQPDVIGRAFALLDFVASRPLDRILAGCNEEDGRQAGEAVGLALTEICRFQFERPGLFDGELVPTGRPTAAAAGVLSYVGERLFSPQGLQALGAAGRDRVWAALQRDAEVLSGVGTETTLVHGDYNPKNLLMKRSAGRWEVVAVIDWEFAFSGSPLWDVANMLRFRKDYPTAFANAFVACYQGAGGLLPGGWPKICRVMDSVNLSEFLVNGSDGPFYAKARRLLLDAAEDNAC